MCSIGNPKIQIPDFPIGRNLKCFQLRSIWRVEMSRLDEGTILEPWKHAVWKRIRWHKLAMTKMSRKRSFVDRLKIRFFLFSLN